MVSLPIALALMAVLLAGEWFYIRTFFTRVEPALIARVESALDVKIGFGLFHHWEVRDAGAQRGAAQRFAVSAAVFAIHLGVMLAFAVGLLALAGLVFGPAIWLHRRG